jgi:hypothetical protein
MFTPTAALAPEILGKETLVVIAEVIFDRNVYCI